MTGKSWFNFSMVVKMVTNSGLTIENCEKHVVQVMNSGGFAIKLKKNQVMTHALNPFLHGLLDCE